MIITNNRPNGPKADHELTFKLNQSTGIGHVGCNLCVCVCPVEDCITMETISGVDPRTKQPIDPEYGNWTVHPNNLMAVEDAAE